MAQIHRFHDSVAIHIGDGQTVYLTPDTARAIARALTACAYSVESIEFSESNFKTRQIVEGVQTDTADAVKRRKELR